MNKMLELSTTEQQVLLAIHWLGDNAYGVTIRDKIAERAKRNLSFGSVYAVLERLDDAGFLTTREGEATKVRGGRKKLFYKITGTGYASLQASLDTMDNMRKGFKGTEEALA